MTVVGSRTLLHNLLVRLRLSEDQLVHQFVLQELHCRGVESGLPVVEVLVYLHLLLQAAVSIPGPGTRQLSDVSEYGGGLRHCQVPVNQHGQLLERQFGSFPVLSSVKNTNKLRK